MLNLKKKTPCMKYIKVKMKLNTWRICLYLKNNDYSLCGYDVDGNYALFGLFVRNPYAHFVQKVATCKVFGFCTFASYISFAHPLVIVSALGSFIFVLGRIRSSFWVAQRRWRWGWSGDRGEQRPGCNPCRTPSVPLSMSSLTRLRSWRTLLRNRESEK